MPFFVSLERCSQSQPAYFVSWCPFLSWYPCWMLAKYCEWYSVSRNTRSLHLHCPARPVEFYAQRERCTISAAYWLPQWCQPRWILLSCSFPPKKNIGGGGGCGTLWQGPLGGPSLPHQKKNQKKKEGEEEQERDHIRPWRMLLRRLPHRLRCFLSLLKRLFSFRLLVANCTKRSQWTRRTLTRKGKKRDDDLSWTICVFMSHEWCWLFHSVASTRNLGVAPLMLWTPLILRRYLTIVCFWLWCCPARSFWLQHQLVASRCSTFAPERLIGIFWVRRRILSRPPCVQSIV